jgi:hypothetical protein
MSAPVRETCGGGGDHGGGVQNADQHASNKQDATSDATSEQDHPSNVNIPVRIFSDGDGGSVEQTNSSSAKSAAGNKNDTDQSVEQGSGSKSAPVRDACGGGCGSHDGPSVQNAEQKAYNANHPVRIGSPGGGRSPGQRLVGDLGGGQQEPHDAECVAGRWWRPVPEAGDKCGGGGPVSRRAATSAVVAVPRRAGRQPEGIQRPVG